MFDILKKKWIFFGIAIVLSLISIVSLIFQGFNLDTDFSGGIALTYEINGEFTTGDITSLVNDAIEGKKASSIQKAGSDVIVKVGYDKNMTDDERAEFSASVKESLTTALEGRFGAPVVDNENQNTEAAAEATAAPETTRETMAEPTIETEAPGTKESNSSCRSYSASISYSGFFGSNIKRNINLRS